MSEGEISFNSPLIRSGPNKARIRNPDTAHEVFNTITAGSRSRRKKIELLNKHSDDVLLIKQAAKLLKEEEQARIDPLTKLHVKSLFKPSLEQDIDNLISEKVKVLGVMRMDLDYFSWVNDVLEAHDLGDIYLEETGNIIRNRIRSQDLAFRIGGDEFLIIVKDSFSESEFRNIVERIHIPLNSEILRKTLQALLKPRAFTTKEGFKEREGSVAIRQFITGLQNLKDNKERRRQHFLDHGRGSTKEKAEFLSRLKNIDLTNYNSLLLDTRPASLLNQLELEKRLALEQTAIKLIEHVLSNLGVSTAAVFLQPSDKPNYHEIQDKLEQLVYRMKREGGRNYLIENGLNKN